MTENGLVTSSSAFSVSETVSRLESALCSRGLTLFARIDHAAGAAEANMKLRPTQLLVFGNARGGTPLMQADQLAGIDLPLKALVWEDAQGRVYLSTNAPAWISRRHNLPSTVDAAVSAMTLALEGLVKSATVS